MVCVSTKQVNSYANQLVHQPTRAQFGQVVRAPTRTLPNSYAGQLVHRPTHAPIISNVLEKSLIFPVTALMDDVILQL